MNPINQTSYYSKYNNKNPSNKSFKTKVVNFAINLKTQLNPKNDVRILDKLNDITIRIQRRINCGTLVKADINRYKNELNNLLGYAFNAKTIEDYFKCCILLSKHSTDNSTKINYFGITNKTESISDLIANKNNKSSSHDGETNLIKEFSQFQSVLVLFNELQEADLQGADLQGADLQGANLQNADLQGAQLQGAQLQGAQLQGAYLQNAKLQGAQLQGAYLQNAKLQNAKLWVADLREADLQWAQLQGANLQGAILQNADLQGAKLRGAQFRGAQLQGAKLQGANLQKADLQGAYLQGAQLQNTKLWEADLREADLQWAYLQGAQLWASNLQGAKLREAQLREAQLQEAKLQKADLQGANLQRAQLQKADLWAANLQGAKLREADLQGAYLQRAQLQGAQLQGAQLQGVQLRDAQLQGANLQGAKLQNTKLWEADLREADLQGAYLQGAQLWASNLQGAQLREAQLQGANLQRAKLQGAQLQGADLQGAYLQGANLQGAIFDDKTQITLQFSPSLDLDFNHINNPSGSILTAINSIDNKNIKIELMKQVFTHLKDENIENIVEALKDVIFNGDYSEALNAVPIFKDMFFKQIYTKGNTTVLNFNSIELQVHLQVIQSMNDDDFNKFTITNNGFFLQLIHQGMYIEALKNLPKSQYARYLVAKNIIQQNKDSNEYVINNTNYAELTSDYEDVNSLLETSRLFISQKNNQESTEEFLMVNNHYMDKFLYGKIAQHLTDISWGNMYHFIANQYNNHPMLSILFDKFVLFKERFIFEEQHTKFIALIKLLNLGSDEKYFLDAIKEDSSSGKKFVSVEAQQQIAEKFWRFFNSANKNKRESVGDKIKDELALHQEHINNIFTIYEFDKKSNIDKATLLLLLSGLFAKYSSSRFFGTETDSPLLLRYYAYGLMKAANNLAPSLISQFEDWENKFLGQNSAFTCTAILSDSILSQCKKFENYTVLLSGIIPPAWG